MTGSLRTGEGLPLEAAALGAKRVSRLRVAASRAAGDWAGSRAGIAQWHGSMVSRDNTTTSHAAETYMAIGYGWVSSGAMSCASRETGRWNLLFGDGST